MKPSKTLMQFERFCKQVDALKAAISECVCEITDQSRVLVLKTKINSLDERIENTFSELSFKEHVMRILGYL